MNAMLPIASGCKWLQNTAGTVYVLLFLINTSTVVSCSLGWKLAGKSKVSSLSHTLYLLFFYQLRNPILRRALTGIDVMQQHKPP